MRQLTWETIANHEVSVRGANALAINPRARSAVLRVAEKVREQSGA